MQHYEFTGTVDGKAYSLMNLRDYAELTSVSMLGKDEINLFLASILKKYFGLDAGVVPKSTAEYYLLHLFLSSLNQDGVTLVADCCEHKTQYKLDAKLKLDNTPIKHFELSPEIKITFKEPTFFDTDIINLIQNNILVIYKDNQTFSVDELQEKELTELYSLITLEIIEEIKNELLRPRISIDQPIVCSCGKHTVKSFIGFDEIFKAIL